MRIVQLAEMPGDFPMAKRKELTESLLLREIPRKFPDNSGDRFAYDCLHHQLYQALTDLADANIRRVLQLILQFCSRFELEHRPLARGWPVRLRS